MSIEVRNVESPEMQRNIRTVKRMTKGMSFDENMGKVNYPKLMLRTEKSIASILLRKK